MNTYVLTIVLSLICTNQVSKESTTGTYNLGRNNEYIKVPDSTYSYGDEIKLLVNGKLRATGDCTASPQLGLIRKNSLNYWDTLIAVNELPVLTCGFDSYVWRKDTITIFLPELVKPYILEKMSVTGIYRFTFISHKRGKAVIGSSNEFEIELKY